MKLRGVGRLWHVDTRVLISP